MRIFGKLLQKRELMVTSPLRVLAGELLLCICLAKMVEDSFIH